MISAKGYIPDDQVCVVTSLCQPLSSSVHTSVGHSAISSCHHRNCRVPVLNGTQCRYHVRYDKPFLFNLTNLLIALLCSFSVIDVGQSAGRQKWIHGFEDVTSIIFVVSIAGYDEVCVEDGETVCLLALMSLVTDSIVPRCRTAWLRAFACGNSSSTCEYSLEHP